MGNTLKSKDKQTQGTWARGESVLRIATPDKAAERQHAEITCRDPLQQQNAAALQHATLAAAHGRARFDRSKKAGVISPA
jgi:hypothetical protein